MLMRISRYTIEKKWEQGKLTEGLIHGFLTLVFAHATGVPHAVVLLVDGSSKKGIK
jgi:hypothetical protein